MKVVNPMDLFTLELQDTYSAENQITEALPNMVKAATDKELKKGFETHLKETKEQVKRLEKIGKLLGVEVEGKECAGMKGLLKEGEEVMKLTGDPTLLDLGLISGARKVEHYEMINYTSLIMLANHLEEDEVADLLQETLDEEVETDEKLESIADSEGSSSAISNLIEEGKKLLNKS